MVSCRWSRMSWSQPGQSDRVAAAFRCRCRDVDLTSAARSQLAGLDAALQGGVAAGPGRHVPPPAVQRARPLKRDRILVDHDWCGPCKPLFEFLLVAVFHKCLNREQTEICQRLQVCFRRSDRAPLNHSYYVHLVSRRSSMQSAPGEGRSERRLSRTLSYRYLSDVTIAGQFANQTKSTV